MPSGYPLPKTMRLTVTNKETGRLVFSLNVTQFSGEDGQYTYTSKSIRQTILAAGISVKLEPTP